MTADPTVARVHAAAYEIPTDQPEADGTFAWTSTTLVLVEVSDGEHTGLGWTYGAVACTDLVRDVLEPVVAGRPVLDVVGSWQAMVDAIRNIGRPGVAGYALSAVDVALWDLKARVLQLPLHRLFGRTRDAVPLYGSGGFTTYDDETTRRQVEGWLAQGMPAVKLKIAEDRGQRVDRDLARLRLVAGLVEARAEVLVDANGGYSQGQAIRVGHALDDLGATWFEEPVPSEDLTGLAAVRTAVRADVAAGEYAPDLTTLAGLCDGAVDCLQADATRCGGYTEWFRGAAVAASRGLQISGHCAPLLHAPAAAATPNLRHVEWFHDHARIEALAFDGAAEPAGGCLTLGTSPGIGVVARTSDLLDYRVR